MDFVKGKPAAGAEHPSRLAVETALIADVHAYVLHPDHVERSIIKGQVDGIADLKRDGLVQPNALSKHSPGLNVALCYVDAGHVAAVLDRKRTGRASDPAADMEDPRSRTKTGELREVASRADTANVEVLKRDEVVWREVVDVLPGLGQRCQERFAQMRPAVVGGP